MGDDSATSTTLDAGTSTSSMPPLTTTTVSPPSILAPDGQEIDAEVVVPEGPGPFPAVVLVHGGGWVTGAPSIMRPLADHLNANGFLTVNTRYSLATLDRPGFPDAIEDVACAVRFAANHPDSDGTVAVIGHSAGAHIGGLVALTGDEYGAACPFPGSGLPDRFVGLAGPYDVSRLGPAVGAFFGGGPDRLPEVWRAGNPQLHTDANTELVSLIMHGEKDGLVADSFAVAFHKALKDSGSDALIELVEEARHNDMDDPDLVGDLIVTWLSRARG
ncbi:MAG TPA: alpha/beta hydrolase [Acidimicrobiia bacterium]